MNRFDEIKMRVEDLKKNVFGTDSYELPKEDVDWLIEYIEIFMEANKGI